LWLVLDLCFNPKWETGLGCGLNRTNR